MCFQTCPGWQTCQSDGTCGGPCEEAPLPEEKKPCKEQEGGKYPVSVKCPYKFGDPPPVDNTANGCPLGFGTNEDFKYYCCKKP